MTSSASGSDIRAALSQLERGVADGQLSAAAAANIRRWLTEPQFAEYAGEVARQLAAGLWRELEDAFWTVIPFGTGGRRGQMYPIGTNAINDRTIGESAQGLADYVRQKSPGGDLACAIAYDTRHRSRHFAELCAGIMVANGFRVFLLDDYRSTPELSFLVRHHQCACGIMVTASHNPPSDNAVKVYWSTGGQVLPPHDRGIIDCVMRVDTIRRTDFATAVRDGRVEICTAETDAGFLAAVLGQSTPGPRGVRILYSPLHGVGISAVVPVLTAAGFAQVEVYPPHAVPSGDFPNVPGHVANPENPAVFDELIDHARRTGAELVLATDPDCDRMGCAAPVTRDPAGPWQTFDGQQLGALLTDFVLERRRLRHQLSPADYVVKTLVTTELVRRIADGYGVRTVGDLLVGFKWIGGVIDEEGPEHFAFGTEESHGFLVGQYARDKDAAVACLLMSELAAAVKAAGQSLPEKLEALSWQYGCHRERLFTVTLPGAQGMAQMQDLMARLRTAPPALLGGLEVVRVRDYLGQQTRAADGSMWPLAGPQGDLVILDLSAPGNYVAVRPSGTEPKIKFYLFTFVPPELLADLEATRQELDLRLQHLAADMRQFAGELKV